MNPANGVIKSGFRGSAGNGYDERRHDKSLESYMQPRKADNKTRR